MKTRFISLVTVFAFTAAACSSGGVANNSDDSFDPTPLPRGENTELLVAFLDRLAPVGDAVFETKYDFGGSADIGLDAGTLKIAQRPPQYKTAYVSGSADGPAFTFIGDADGTAVCNRPASSAGFTCLQTSLIMTETTQLVTLNDLLGVVDELRRLQGYFKFSESTREIAGVETSCLVAEATDAITDEARDIVGTRAELCLAPDGIPLLLEISGASNPISARATEFTTDVPDSAFDLPAPIADAGVGPS